MQVCMHRDQDDVSQTQSFKACCLPCHSHIIWSSGQGSKVHGRLMGFTTNTSYFIKMSGADRTGKQGTWWTKEPPRTGKQGTDLFLPALPISLEHYSTSAAANYKLNAGQGSCTTMPHRCVHHLLHRQGSCTSKVHG